MYDLDVGKILKQIKQIIEPAAPVYVYIREDGSKAPWRLFFNNRPSRKQFAQIARYRSRGCKVFFWSPPKCTL